MRRDHEARYLDQKLTAIGETFGVGGRGSGKISDICPLSAVEDGTVESEETGSSASGVVMFSWGFGDTPIASSTLAVGDSSFTS